jgi:hypothetical protein
MADINLKTETPDTSLPSDGFLFGADSQAAASPSVYTTQAVATTLLGSTTLSGTTITANAPVLNLSQTWNNAAVTFTGLQFNAATGSSAGSASASLLLDLQLEGTTRFNVNKLGHIRGIASSANYLYQDDTGTWSFTTAGLGNTPAVSIKAGSFQILSTGFFSFSNSSNSNGNQDTILTRRGAANLRLGAADAAAPVAQTFSVQSVVAGTTNGAGANFTITGSQGTGSGAGGSIIFQVAPAAGSSGTGQNTLVNALTINSDRNLVIRNGGYIRTEGAQPNSGIRIGGNGFNEPILATEWVNGGSVAFSTGRFGSGSSWLAINSTSAFGWGNSTDLGTSSPSLDVTLYRDAANTLALRNGAAAQAFRIYNTTDGTNSESLNAYWAGNTAYLLTVGVGTGPARNLAIGTAANSATLTLWTSGVERWRIDGSGHLIAVTDNTYDIGAAAGSRPRNVYVAGAIQVQGVGGLGVNNTGYIFWLNSTSFRNRSDGVLTLSNYAENDFGRLQFGGTTSSFPALKRSTTFLQARLADDSAACGFSAANIQAETAYTVATLPTPATGMMARVTDATAPVVGSTVTGGGAAYALVNYNGANWTVIGV